MPTQSKNLPIDEFLAVTAGSKDIGLIIAQNAEELTHFKKQLADADFTMAKNWADLMKTPQKVFVIADENIEKNIYDFIIQYQTGQVSIFDAITSTWQSISPDYENSAFVILMQKGVRSALFAKGINFMPAVGPAFQS